MLLQPAHIFITFLPIFMLIFLVISAQKIMILGIEKQKTNGRGNARPLVTVISIIINFVLKF
jgi:hypothetical protein